MVKGVWFLALVVLFGRVPVWFGWVALCPGLVAPDGEERKPWIWDGVLGLSGWEGVLGLDGWVGVLSLNGWDGALGLSGWDGVLGLVGCEAVVSGCEFLGAE